MLTGGEAVEVKVKQVPTPGSSEARNGDSCNFGILRFSRRNSHERRARAKSEEWEEQSCTRQPHISFRSNLSR